MQKSKFVWYICKRLTSTIGNECTSRFGLICPLWRALVPFLNVAKLLILLRLCLVATDASIDQIKHTEVIPKVENAMMIDN